jgi:hypothetical protein
MKKGGRGAPVTSPDNPSQSIASYLLPPFED